MTVRHELEFTGASFHRISTLEARRGRDDPAQRFPDVQEIIRELKDVHAARRRACTGLWKTDRTAAAEAYGSFRKQISGLRAAKRKALEAALEELSSQLSKSLEDGAFTWGLKRGLALPGRQVYSIADDAIQYFTRKQLETNLKRAHSLKPPNRNRVVAQLRDAIAGPIPKYVLRTDISSFFESIPHAVLVAELDPRNALSATSRLLIQRLLDEWVELTGVAIGVPTGVGLAASLAEVYARRVDADVAAEAGVRYYGRYVDDIVIVTDSAEARMRIRSRLDGVLRELGLAANAAKTQVYDPNGATCDLDSPIEYLGYALTKVKGEVSVALADRTLRRYDDRLQRAFARWDAVASVTSGHEGLLLDRVRFLTGNTKLANSKGRAVTGVYFNHPVVTDPSSFATLDARLKSLVAARDLPSRLQSRLSKASFAGGFERRTFHTFSQEQLKRVVAVWREP